MLMSMTSADGKRFRYIAIVSFGIGGKSRTDIDVRKRGRGKWKYTTMRSTAPAEMEASDGVDVYVTIYRDALQVGKGSVRVFPDIRTKLKYTGY